MISIYGNGNNGRRAIAQNIDHIINPNIDDIMTTITAFVNSRDIYEKTNVPYKIGILLHGPSGTGKTSVAKSIALELNRPLYIVNINNLGSYHPSRTRSTQSSYISPAVNSFVPACPVILIDEIDAQLMPDISNTSKQKKVKTELLLKLLSYIDSLDNGEIVIGTTNHMENLDPKVLRSGRFDCHYEFDNIGYDDCVKLVHSRGIDDADKILDGKTFPYNPSTLEQDCMAYLIKQHNLPVADKESLSEIIDEMGDDNDTNDSPLISKPENCGVVFRSSMLPWSGEDEDDEYEDDDEYDD